MKKNSGIYILSAVCVVSLGLAVVFFLRDRSKKEVIEEISAQFELEKEELEDDYSQLALQYESYGIRIDNDSLAELLDAERTKNLRLMEEIKTLKINNAHRLSELKKELETARGVMRTYIVQIDSLNTVNTRLKQENQTISRQYREARETVSQLEQENIVLAQRMQLAQKLEASAIVVKPLTEKGRIANRISRISVIEFGALISKNISADVGEKHIYLLVTQPDETPLLKADAKTFEFEGSRIPCSASRVIEYDGEEQAVTIYWQVEEFLYPGTYRADFFADGYLIGSREFTLSD